MRADGTPVPHSSIRCGGSCRSSCRRGTAPSCSSSRTSRPRRCVALLERAERGRPADRRVTLLPLRALRHRRRAHGVPAAQPLRRRQPPLRPPRHLARASAPSSGCERDAPHLHGQDRVPARRAAAGDGRPPARRRSARAAPAARPPPTARSRASSACPAPLLRLAVRAQRVLDGWNLLPAALIKDDPLYASAFIANLGSVGLDAAFHHLYDYGTMPDLRHHGPRAPRAARAGRRQRRQPRGVHAALHLRRARRGRLLCRARARTPGRVPRRSRTQLTAGAG